MKYFLIICIILMNFTGLFSTQYNVSVVYMGLEVVEGLLSIDDVPDDYVFTVDLKVRTTSFYDFFYNVDNSYSSSYSYNEDGCLDFASHTIISNEGSKGIRTEHLAYLNDILEIDSSGVEIPEGKQVVNSFALFKYLPSQDYSDLLLYSDKNLWNVHPRLISQDDDTIIVEYSFSHFAKLIDKYYYTDILSRKLINSDSRITITYKGSIVAEIAFEALLSDLLATMHPAK